MSTPFIEMPQRAAALPRITSSPPRPVAPADCVEKEMRDEHAAELTGLLEKAEVEGIYADDFRRYGSARKLYNFDVDNAGSY